MSTFKKLILLGRPASGKSEFIDFLKNLTEAEKKDRYHIGKIYELDDFLWLWQKFVEDDLWEKAVGNRFFSVREGHGYLVSNNTLLDFCLEKFNAEIGRQPADGTVFVEFSRGKPHGGYQYALRKLSDELLKDAAILFIYTSYEEACRRNESRYREKLKHSVLAHKVPEKDMIVFGKEIDWERITNNKTSGLLKVRGLSIPFVTMNNEPELKPGPETAKRYQSALDQLMRLYQKKPTLNPSEEASCFDPPKAVRNSLSSCA